MRGAIIASLLMTPPAYAGEVWDSYEPRLHVAADWAEISWSDQIRIAREIAKEQKLDGFWGGGAPNLVVCLDLAASDEEFRQLPFATMLQLCIRRERK
jgi:hypothetical protein